MKIADHKTAERRKMIDQMLQSVKNEHHFPGF